MPALMYCFSCLGRGDNMWRTTGCISLRSKGSMPSLVLQLRCEMKGSWHQGGIYQLCQ